jgi:hypothetical protein
MGILHIDPSSIQFDRSSCAWQGGHDNKKRSTRETEKDEKEKETMGQALVQCVAPICLN